MGDTIFKKKGRPLSKVTKTHIEWAKTYELPKLEALRLAGRDSIQDTGEGSWLGLKKPGHPATRCIRKLIWNIFSKRSF